MVAKYPQQTAAKKKPPVKTGQTIKGSPAANDNKIGPLKLNSLPKLAGAVVLRRINPFHFPVSLAIEIGKAAFPEEAPAPLSMHRQIMSSQYWVYSVCGSCPQTPNVVSDWSATCCATHGSTVPWGNGLTGMVSTTGIRKAWKVWEGAGYNQYYRRHVGWWSKKTGAPAIAPVDYWAPLPHNDPLGRPAPRVWPIATPIFPGPAPSPWAKPEPWAEPAAETKPDKEPAWDPGPKAPLVISLPWDGSGDAIVDPATGASIQPRPRNVNITAGRGRPRVSTSRNNARQEQPPRGVKQHKPNIVQVGGVGWVLFNFATEALDFASNLYDSLPEEVKGGSRPSMKQKLKKLFEHWDKIDVDKAIQLFLNDQIEDMLWGSLGKPTKDLTQRLGMATGVDRAINQNMSGWFEAVNSYYHEQGMGSPPSLFQVEIDFDGPVDSVGIVNVDINWETGEVSIAR